MAKVSIIVPVYNTEKYMDKCLEMLTGQTLEDIEILLINDGSTDSSPAIMENWRARFPEKIRIINKENGGQGSARNMGIAEATGEYIGFMDSDDWCTLDMFERMYGKAHSDNLDFVECLYYYQKEDGTQLPPYTETVRYASNKDMFFNTMAAPWNKLIRASLLKDNDVRYTEGCIYEDTAFFLKVIPWVKSSDLIEEKFVYHIDWGGSTMNINKSKRVAHIFTVLQDAIDYYKDKGVYELYSKELEYFCVRVLFCSSLVRIASVPDRALREELLAGTWEMIEREFLDYKKNDYFNQGARGRYIKSMNRATSALCLAVLHLREKIRG